jgi:hypothetical protein
MGGFGGGFHSGAYAGGFHGGLGPAIRGFHGHDYGHLRYGYRPYGYWNDYAYDYPYYDSYYDNGSCYVVQRRLHTAHGSHLHPRRVCG